jgi:subtilisin family serine protease
MADDVYFLGKGGERIGLRELKVAPRAVHSGAGGRVLAVSGRSDATRVSGLVTATARSVFEMDALGLTQLFGARAERARDVKAPPTVFEDDDHRIRVVYKELVARFRPGVTTARRNKILGEYGLSVRHVNAFVARQYTLTQETVRYAGVELIAVANRLAELEEVEFCAPHFVSEYVRTRAPAFRPAQWHLSTVGAAAAWAITRGSPDVVVAVIDDGVDLAHPNLANRIKRKPDSSNPKDRVGRDFFLPPDDPDHYDPSPKRFRYPYEETDINDIHGTPCAGVIAANGRKKVYGVAPNCRILPVKIFHGSDLAADGAVADSLRYASRCAQIVSLSWTGTRNPDLQFALEDVGAARGGRGTVVVAASGNSDPKGLARVSYPAADPNAIAVGAVGDDGVRSWYSDYGSELSVVAPSNGGAAGIFTTDVSVPSRGYNLGSTAAGGTDGLYTNDFGGTSSATPLVAGIVALLLSVNPDLTRSQVKTILEATADKVGPKPYDAKGFHREYGYGRVNAAAALAHPLVGAAVKPRKPRKPKKPKKLTRKRE